MFKTDNNKKKHILRNSCLGLVGALLLGGVVATADFGLDYFEAKKNAVQESADEDNRVDFEDEDIMVEELSNKVQTVDSELLVDYVDVSDVVEEAIKMVVAVNCVEYQTYNNGYYGFMYGQSQTVEVPSCGTGIIIARHNEDLIILTNNHVVEDADEVSIAFVNGKEIKASVLGTAPDSDIALVGVALEDIDEETMQSIAIATLGDSDAVRVGSAAIAIGNALGYGQSVTTGVISALNREVNLVDMTLELMQTDAPINSGNSGGPLLNVNGEVIGINSAKYSDTGVEGMGYAIPINTAKPIIEEILNTSEKPDEEVNVDKPYLGIYGMTLTEQYQFMYGMPAGIYLIRVEENSPAASAGLTAGDIITSIDGTEVTTMEELSAVLENHKPGDTVSLGVKILMRNSYRSAEVQVTLGTMPEE